MSINAIEYKIKNQKDSSFKGSGITVDRFYMGGVKGVNPGQDFINQGERILYL